MDYLLGSALGGLTAFVFSLPAIVEEIVEHGKVKNIPLLVDAKSIWGRKLKSSEVFLVALLIHLVLGTLFGLIYVLFVRKGWLVFTNRPYTIESLIIYAVCAWIVTGVLIFPALGFGLFGRREGERVWLELLISMLLIGTGMWFLVQFYQPFFFMT